MAHNPIKPEKLAAAAAELVEAALVVPNFFRRKGIDEYKGARDDTVNVKVPGVLPWRNAGWRNDRSQPIVLDEYAERSVATKFGHDLYSGVAMIDEQALMDFDSFTDLVGPQAEAVGRGLERLCVDTLADPNALPIDGGDTHSEGSAYNVTLGGAVAGRDLRGTLIRAREILTRFNQPTAGRVLLVGTAWESALLNDDRMNLAQNVGDNVAESALTEATIGRRFGFTIVVSPEIDPNSAYALGDSPFVLATAGPLTPTSVPFGATASTGRVGGISLRWMRDYDFMFQRDRSAVNIYAGTNIVKDPLVGLNAQNQAFVSANNHFVRAIALDLEASSDSLPTGTVDTPAGELAQITGVGTATPTP